jgi:hypothetical protein
MPDGVGRRLPITSRSSTAFAVLLIALGASAQLAHSAQPFYEGKTIRITLEPRLEVDTIHTLALLPVTSANIFPGNLPSSLTICLARAGWFLRVISSK